jgi:hypothetical protein
MKRNHIRLKFDIRNETIYVKNLDSLLVYIADNKINDIIA